MKKISINRYIKTLGILAFFVFQNGYGQVAEQKDTLYFDRQWKPTTRQNHEYYRLHLEKTGKLSLIIDYYKNGNMQMQGYAYTDSLDILVGFSIKKQS